MNQTSTFDRGPSIFLPAEDPFLPRSRWDKNSLTADGSMTRTYQYIGKAVARRDASAVVTGGAHYVDDLKFSNPPIFRVLDRKVRYVGDAVALVAADTVALAEEAMGLIEVLPAVFDDFEARQPQAPQLYETLAGNRLPLGDPILGPESMTEIVMGDVEQGFAQADAAVQGTFSYDNIPNPIPMESPAAVAHWQTPDQVTLWVSNQSVWLNKKNFPKRG